MGKIVGAIPEMLSIIERLFHEYGLLGGSVAVTLLVFWLAFRGGLRSFVLKLAKPHQQAFAHILISFFHRDESRYVNLCKQMIARRRVGGMLKYDPDYSELNDVNVDLECGIAKNNVKGASSLIDNLMSVSMTNVKSIFNMVLNGAKQNYIILGGPGAGKSTVISSILRNLLKTDRLKVVPVPMILRDCKSIFTLDATSNEPFDVLQSYYKTRMGREDGDFPRKWLIRKLKKGQCLILFDGVDELESEVSRSCCNRWMKLFSTKYPKNRYVVTARPHGVNRDVIADSVVRYVAPLSVDLIKDFVHQWYKVVAKKENSEKYQQYESRLAELKGSVSKRELKSIKRDFMKEYDLDRSAISRFNSDKAEGLVKRLLNKDVLSELARRPMFLSMMSLVHYKGDTLPEHRCRLFDSVLDVMLGGRSESKGIAQKYSMDLKVGVLSDLAFSMLSRGRAEVNQKELSEFLVSGSSKYSEDLELPAFIEEVVTSSGLIICTSDDSYAFYHKSFMEFMAAHYIKSRSFEFDEEWIIAHAIDPKWSEALLLLVGMINATKIVEGLIRRGDKRNLYFLVLTLHEALSVDADVRSEAHSYIEQFAQSADQQDQYYIGMSFIQKKLREIRSASDECRLIGPITKIESMFLHFESHGSYPGLDNQTVSKSGEILYKGSRREVQKICDWLKSHQGDGWDYRLPRVGGAEMQNLKHFVWVGGSANATKKYHLSRVSKFSSTVLSKFRETVVFDTAMVGDSIYRVSSGGNPFLHSRKKANSESMDKLIRRYVTLTYLSLDSAKQIAIYFYAKLAMRHLSAYEFTQTLSERGFSSLECLVKFVGIKESSRKEVDKEVVEFETELKSQLSGSIADNLLGVSISEIVPQIVRQIDLIGRVEPNLQNYLNSIFAQSGGDDVYENIGFRIGLIRMLLLLSFCTAKSSGKGGIVRNFLKLSMISVGESGIKDSVMRLPMVVVKDSEYVRASADNSEYA